MISICKVIYLDWTYERSSGFLLQPISGKVYSKRFINEKSRFAEELEPNKIYVFSSFIDNNLMEPDDLKEYGDNVVITPVEQINNISEFFELHKLLGDPEIVQCSHGNFDYFGQEPEEPEEPSS